jgi:alpha-beta hydrolase superfamily lysophospholipase
MTLELRYLRTTGGAAVAALDYGARRPRGVSLAVGHGYSSSKANLDSLCAFLAGHGFNVVSIDFPGHKLGASGGRLAGPETLVEALAAAVSFARETYGPRVYTLGHSMGATTALRTCAADAGIAGAISIASGYGRPAALAALAGRASLDLRSAYVDGLALPELVALTEPLLDGALAALAGRPVLYIAAERDGMISRTSVEQLFARAPEPKTFATVASDHTYAGEHSRATVLAWLNQLHPRP